MMHDEPSPAIPEKASPGTKPPPGSERRTRKPAPYSQAVEIQEKLRSTLRNQNCPPSAVALLAKSWLELEQFKRSVRGKAAARREAKAESNPAPFVEPDEPAAGEPGAQGEPEAPDPDPAEG